MFLSLGQINRTPFLATISKCFGIQDLNTWIVRKRNFIISTWHIKIFVLLTVQRVVRLEVSHGGNI
jgi:hypothetical protein